MNTFTRFRRGAPDAYSRPAWRCVWALLLLAGLCGAAAAQEDQGLAVPVTVIFKTDRPVGELALTRTALARLLPACPLVNGLLDEPAWHGASVLTPLCRAGGARIALPRTVAMAGYYAGFLYIGIQCDEPDPKRRRGIVGERDGFSPDEDCVQILLDSTLERGQVKIISVNPAGVVTDYAVAGQERDMAWNIECIAAASPTATGWSVEIGIPRRALANPINDIIGFNIVRRRPGDPGEPFSWNPAPAAYENGEALGSLAFQRRQVTVQKVELGWPHVGTNTFRVWLKNETPERFFVRAGVATHVAGEAADVSRYLIAIPPGRARAHVLSHRIRTAGRTEVALTLLDYEMGDPLARVTRSGLDVSPSPIALMPDEKDGGAGTDFDFRILLPKRDVKRVSLLAAFRDATTGRILGNVRTGWATSRNGRISVNAAGLEPGTYCLEVQLEREGEVFGSAERDVVIGLPEALE